MKKLISLILTMILVMLLLPITSSYAYNKVPISPINAVYKEGIYQIDELGNGGYDLKYQFLDKNKKSAIIILDENYDIQYKNVNCNRKCNAGTITNKSIIIIVGNGDVALEFTKLN